MFARDRADLGPGHAAELAATEAARYAPARSLDAVLAELHVAWTGEQRCRDRLSLLEPMRQALRELITLQPHSVEQLAGLTGAHGQAAWAADQAERRVEASDAAVTAEADRLRDVLLRCWDGERAAVQAAARVVLDGPGRLGLRRGAVVRAGEQLADWADRWRSHLPQLPTDPGPLARVAGRIDDRPTLWAALDASARRTAERAHPEHAALLVVADAAQHACEQAWQALAKARRHYGERLARFGALAWTPDPEQRLANAERDIATTKDELSAAQARVGQLSAEPAILAQPADRLVQERAVWRVRRDSERAARRAAAAAASSPRATGSPRPPEPVPH